MIYLLSYYYFLLQVAAPSSGGKTSFIVKYINCLDKSIDTNIEEIYYATPSNHNVNLLGLDRKIIVLDGLPELEFFTCMDKSVPKLLIIDDFAYEKNELSKITQLFTRISHHYSISMFFVTQNIFEKGIRTISLNSHYLVIFKNLRDSSQIKSLARQIYPENSLYLLEAYRDATEKPFGYLLIDLTQKCRDILRFRTNIFPSDFPQNIIYVPRNQHIKSNLVLEV